MIKIENKNVITALKFMAENAQADREVWQREIAAIREKNGGDLPPHDTRPKSLIERFAHWNASETMLYMLVHELRGGASTDLGHRETRKIVGEIIDDPNMVHEHFE